MFSLTEHKNLVEFTFYINTNGNSGPTPPCQQNNGFYFLINASSVCRYNTPPLKVFVHKEKKAIEFILYHQHDWQ